MLMYTQTEKKREKISMCYSLSYISQKSHTLLIKSVNIIRWNIINLCTIEYKWDGYQGKYINDDTPHFFKYVSQSTRVI